VQFGGYEKVIKDKKMKHAYGARLLDKQENKEGR
jgi:hypothetical protein